MRHEAERSGERYAAYVERHGTDLVVAGADDRVAAYAAVRDLLAREPDAIFAASDRAAITAILALRDHGVSVPDDIAVVGVGNLDEGLITRPTLSTVGPPELDFRDAARLLFDGLREPSPGRVLTTDWTFIRRGSA